MGKGFNVGYINFSQITAHQDWIEKIKIFMPYANNIGTELSDDNLNTFVDEGNMVCTEAYICVGVGHLENKNSAENLANYLQTKFARFMHSLAKASQHATAKTFCFVPVQDFSQSWDDKKLYAKYNLSAEEINFIESTIKPMG